MSYTGGYGEIASRKVVFLDRDGVINRDREDYVKSVDELRVFEYAPSAVKRLNDAGFSVIIISNQQGVAKGLISGDALQAIQDEIVRQVESAGGKIDAFYYCKHFSSDNCQCRKPKPGMLLQAGEDYQVDMKNSFFIGDNEKDVAAGKAAGCTTILVLTGFVKEEDVESLFHKPDFLANNLLEAADTVVQKCQQK